MRPLTLKAARMLTDCMDTVLNRGKQAGKLVIKRLPNIRNDRAD